MTLGRRWGLQAALALAVAGLVALAVWGPEGGDAGPAHQGFAGVATATRLEIDNPREGRTVLEKRGAAWWLAEPFAAPADANILKTLLEGLGAKAAGRFPAAEVDLAAAGLSTPSLTLTLDGRRYAFGGTAPVSYQRYVQDDAGVFLVEEMNHYRLDRPATYFVSRRLLPDGAEVVRIDLPGRTLEHGDDGWSLTPEDAAISADALQALADAWREHSAMEVERLGDTPRGQAEVALTLADGTRLVFEVLTSDEDTRLARRDLGLVYELLPTARRTLLEPRRADPAAPLGAPTGG